jgi:alkylation response protein AidB-like acyl-CoA dehydrogenase
MPNLGMSLLGAEGLLYDNSSAEGSRGDLAQWLQRSYLQSRAASIASGTTEIMKGIIAMQVLGLPRS